MPQHYEQSAKHIRAKFRNLDPLTIRCQNARLWDSDRTYDDADMPRTNIEIFYRNPDWREHLLPRARAAASGKKQMELF